MRKNGWLQLGALAAIAAMTMPATAADRWNVSEPAKLKSPKSMKPGEGALQLSVRTQTQATNTAIFTSLQSINMAAIPIG